MPTASLTAPAVLAVWQSSPAYAEQFLFMRVSNLHLQFVENSYIELQDRGAILIEEYERNIRSDVLMEKAYKTSQYAMWAAIASAVTAIIALFKQ